MDKIYERDILSLINNKNGNFYCALHIINYIFISFLEIKVLKNE